MQQRKYEQPGRGGAGGDEEPRLWSSRCALDWSPRQRPEHGGTEAETRKRTPKNAYVAILSVRMHFAHISVEPRG